MNKENTRFYVIGFIASAREFFFKLYNRPIVLALSFSP